MKNLTRYNGWALVTGASSGIGEAFARQIAAQGIDCMLIALETDATKLEALAAELAAQHGIACLPLTQDLAAPDAVEKTLAAIGDRPVGLLINNAGFGVGGAFATRPPSKIEQLLHVHCRTPLLLTRALLPGMIARRAGAVVFVSSLIGATPTPFEATYSACKAFILNLGQALWGELRGTGVDVVTIYPGATRTRFFEVEGIGEKDRRRLLRLAASPDYVARLALRNLGRKPVVAPPQAWAGAMLARFVTRRFAIRAAQSLVRLLVHYR
ncbi:MAG TPA: SDR family NAD(P)-dependent oxidoreductase [Candidatus Hydrogenedentes bacterium]|nr:SDR family NAD(P)-dependent oxidoreductase [Candidatus Hydrogenedentota bacterium]HOS02095.1 SDR family NAD(P)-dependent oxidoreductase [Candidatus Hydrogenedentota bacterium]